MRQSPLSDVDQCRVAAAIITRQRQQAVFVEQVRALLPEAIRRVNAQKQQVRPRDTGMLTRNDRTIDLRQMQADLQRSGRQLEHLRRQVARERAGSR